MSEKKGTENKKVTFNNIVEINEFFNSPMEKQYRKVYWEIFYIDKLRFLKRIKEIEKIVKPVLLEKLLKYEN